MKLSGGVQVSSPDCYRWAGTRLRTGSKVVRSLEKQEVGNLIWRDNPNRLRRCRLTSTQKDLEILHINAELFEIRQV